MRSPARGLAALATLAAGLGLAAGGAYADDPPAPAVPSAPLGAAGPAEPIATAAYFPLDPSVTLVYDKVTTSRLRPGERRGSFSRGPAPADAAAGAGAAAPPAFLLLVDSEGETMMLGLEAGAPAMAGQSMRAQGFEQRYEPPLGLFPTLARIGEEVTFRSAVEHRTKRATERGAIVRRVVLDGVEDLDLPAGRFAGCLRFRAWTENRPSEDGSFVARVAETTWLAPGVGEVKSEQEVSLETFGIAWMRARVTLTLRARNAAM